MMKTRLAVLALLLAPALALAQAPKKTSPTSGADKPAIVLVHGAWADGSSWDKVVPLLEAKGHKVTAVHLPLTSPADDVAAVTRAIDRYTGDVVLVGHSYGGFVVTEAGNNPKVKKLVYVDAFALDEGETVNALTKAKPPAWLKTLQADSGGYVWMPAESITKFFVPDLPAAEQKLVFAKQGPVPAKGFDVAMKTPAWKTKPSWYLRGTKDQIIDPAAQEQMAKRAKSTLKSIDSGHVPMLSKPEPVAAIILEAASAREATARR
jgi:pimeloyl-ACP methyl ester carboxylesterase